jgi:1-pyrroline-5-carboxylate dehydrogenase
MITDTVLASRDFAGIHFTGSTHVFKDIWAKIELTSITIKHTQGRRNWEKILLSLTQVLTQTSIYIVRGAFEFQGQNVQQLHELMYHKVCGQL